MRRRPAEEPRLSSFRLVLIGSAVLLCLAVVTGRALQMQIIESGKLKGLATDQYLKEMELTAPRGTIYDQSGRPLALSVAVESIYVDPSKFDPADVPALAKALGLPVARIRERIGSKRAFAWIKRLVAPEDAQKVRELDLDHVHFASESKRFYPNRELASHMLGFVGVDGKGLSGLELKLDDYLRGRTAGVSALRDARGNQLSTGGILPVTALEGDDVFVTIERDIQHEAELAVADAVTEFNARAGLAVVLDARSGAVLALANFPTFNPNEAGNATQESRRNRSITDIFEPGSTLKPVIMAAALDGGFVDPDEQIDCEQGAFTIGRHVIRDTHPYDRLDLADVIAKSSNIGMLKIGSRLGAEGVYRSLKRFGFVSRVGIELPGEVQGMLSKPRSWSQVRLATVSFGQGIGVTALQLTAAIGVIAGGGVWRRPYLVERVEARDGTVRYQYEALNRRVIAPQYASLVGEMMEKVTQPGGTGVRAVIPGVRVAGKTGTAQKTDPITGGYSADKRISSFVGFAPVGQPRLVALVVIDEPKGSTYGGTVAAPAWRRIVSHALLQLGVERQAPQDPMVVDAPTSRDEGEFSPIAVSQIAAEMEQVSGVMPDLRGLDIRSALATALASGLELSVQGKGRVVEQQPAPGALLDKTRVIHLLLKADS